MRKGRIIYVLIGPPAIGKSTWIQKYTDPQNTIVINRDDIVEEVASTYKWTYNDMFVQPPDDAEIGEIDEKYGEVIPAPEYMTWRKSVFSKVSEGNDRVLKNFKQSMEDAKASDKNVVVDLTNMRVNDRIDGLNRIARPNDVKIAVIFNFKGKEKIIKAVAAKRAEAAARMGKSKTIPDIVIDKMISGYEPPTPEEGYDKIIYSDTIPQLKKFAGLKEARMYIRKVINELFENKKTLHEAVITEVDFFHIGDQEFDMDDKDAIPFFYYGGQLYLKNVYGKPNFYRGAIHWEIISDIISKGIENGEITIEKGEDGEEYWQDEEESIMEDTKYNGRLWIDRKVISFWKIPEDRFTLKDIIDDLNDDSMGKFHIDGSWKIRIGGERGFPDKLMSIKNYSGGEISDEGKEDLENKWKQHIMSPLEKEKLGLRSVPLGFGSKNPDYLGHRAWDRAIGRAE